LPDARFAETVIALVAPPERAAAIIGDLLERVPRRGETWFWLSVVRTLVATVWQQTGEAPIRMAMHAILGWFGYMLMAAMLLFIAGISLTMLLLAWDVLGNHTGVELLKDAWPFSTSVEVDHQNPLWRAIELFIAAVLAPYLSGHRVVDLWEERGVAFTLVLGMLWASLSIVVPFVLTNRVSGTLLPAIVFFMLAGVVRRRLLTVAC
jgi:hypothetical protein